MIKENRCSNCFYHALMGIGDPDKNNQVINWKHYCHIKNAVLKDEKYNCIDYTQGVNSEEDVKQ